MKKVVLKLDINDDKRKQRVMRIVSSLFGLDSISIDTKEKKLTLIGDIDPVSIVTKLRKVYYTDILSVEVIKEKKDDPKKTDPKKDEPKKIDPKEQAQKMAQAYYNYTPYPAMVQYYHPRSVEEDPNACVIC